MEEVFSFFVRKGYGAGSNLDVVEKVSRCEAAMPTMEAWLQERGLGESEKRTASYPWSEAEGIICSLQKPTGRVGWVQWISRRA